MVSTRFGELALIVSGQCGIPRERLHPETRLLHDAGVWGNDAEQLLLAIGERWGIEWGNFEFAHHFYPESHLFSVAGLLRSLTGVHRSRKAPLTLAALSAAAERGRWIDAPDSA